MSLTLQEGTNPVTLTLVESGSTVSLVLSIVYLEEAPEDGITYARKDGEWVEVVNGVALGETSTTAYRGDRGKIAYDHSQITTGNPHSVTKTDIGLGSVPNTDATNPANITWTSSYRTVTDVQKAAYNKESIIAAVSDETTALTIGTSKISFTAPYALTITSVKADVNTAPTGANLIVDINKNTSTILSTKITIEATEFSSLTATTQPVISDTALAAGDIITIDIDQVGATIAGKGLKITLECTKS